MKCLITWSDQTSLQHQYMVGIGTNAQAFLQQQSNKKYLSIPTQNPPQVGLQPLKRHTRHLIGYYFRVWRDQGHLALPLIILIILQILFSQILLTTTSSRQNHLFAWVSFIHGSIIYFISYNWRSTNTIAKTKA